MFVAYYPSWFSVFYGAFLSLVMLRLSSGGVMSWQETLVLSIVAFVLWLAVFILQGIGLYKMAKKANVKRRYLAFVPFGQIFLVGDLAGEISFFGHKIRRLGLYALILEIVAAVYYVVFAYSLYVLFVENGPNIEIVTNYPQWTNLSSYALGWKKFYDISTFVIEIMSLIHAIVMLMLYLGFYKRYSYRNNVILSLGGIFIPFFNGIATFVLRNREQVDYEAIMRARQEEIRRRQQQWQNTQNPYGGTYNGPYGNQGPYTGGNAGNGGTQKPSSPEDPFGEFSEKPKTDDDPFA